MFQISYLPVKEAELIAVLPMLFWILQSALFRSSISATDPYPGANDEIMYTLFSIILNLEITEKSRFV